MSYHILVKKSKFVLEGEHHIFRDLCCSFSSESHSSCDSNSSWRLKPSKCSTNTLDLTSLTIFTIGSILRGDCFICFVIGTPFLPENTSISLMLTCHPAGMLWWENTVLFTIKASQTLAQFILQCRSGGSKRHLGEDVGFWHVLLELTPPKWNLRLLAYIDHSHPCLLCVIY